MKNIFCQKVTERQRKRPTFRKWDTEKLSTSAVAFLRLNILHLNGVIYYLHTTCQRFIELRRCLDFANRPEDITPFYTTSTSLASPSCPTPSRPSNLSTRMINSPYTNTSALNHRSPDVALRNYAQSRQVPFDPGPLTPIMLNFIWKMLSEFRPRKEFLTVIPYLFTPIVL